MEEKIPATEQSTPPPAGKSTPETPSVPPTPPVSRFAFLKNRKSLVIGAVVLVILLLAGAGGYLYFQNQSLKNQTATTPPPAGGSEATPDPTANWETYINEEKGYSIKYPEDGFLRLICPDEELTVTNDGVGNQTSPVIMSTCARGGRYTLETKTYDSVQTEPEETKYYTIVKKNIHLGGLPAVQYIYTFTNIDKGPFPQWYTIARVNKDNKTYEIWFDEKDELNLFDQILSTFKFTDETSDNNIKTYISNNLGVSFSYRYKYNDGSINIKELGNKIYVYPSTLRPESGQYVEIFNKDPQDSLKAAITKNILEGYSTSDCLVNELSHNPSGNSFIPPSNYKFAKVDVPRTGNEELAELSQKAEKCPRPYVPVGGIAYFLMDQNKPSKFVFFSIGQYAIDAGPNQLWQDTIKFN